MCNHARANIGLDCAYCPDCKRQIKPTSAEYKNLLVLEKPCNESLACSVDRLPCAALRSPMQDVPTNLELPSSLKPTTTDGVNLQNDILSSPATRTSKPLLESEDAGMCVFQERHVKIFPEQIQEETDLLETNQDFGGKCSESSLNAFPDLLSGKMLPPPDTQHQENNIVLSPMLSGVLPQSGTFVNGLLSAHQPLERPISENESYLLLPTPMAHSRAKTSYSHPGQDKLEQKLRELGIVPPGEISTPQFRSWLMGVSLPDTTEVDGGEIIHPPTASAPLLEASQCAESECKPLETLVHPNRERSHGEGSHISISELTIDEERDRHDLERKVERAFYEAGTALRDLRDKKLYRSTHKTFEEYCKNRFGFTRQMASLKILAVDVVDDLSTNGCQILPTSERQVRAIASLPSEERTIVWAEAVEKSKGKVPSGAVVKSIVDTIKEKTFIPYTETSEYVLGDVVIIKASGNSTLRPYDGYWGIIDRVSSFAYHVLISVKNEVVLCKDCEMKRVELGERDKAEIKAVSLRIHALAMRDDLATTASAMLEALSRKTCFTPDDLWFLEKIEERYEM